jgi:predicted nuclease with TOPRIM domain
MTEEEIAAMRNELETLRRTNAELVTKASTRKQKIAELEAANAEIQKTVTQRDATIHELTIGVPLRSMAEDNSTCPEVFIENFGKSYRLELTNGELSIVSIADGKPVQHNGKVVQFEPEALKALLLDEKHPQSKLFRAITIASKASGASASAQRRESTTAPKPSPRIFGLR